MTKFNVGKFNVKSTQIHSVTGVGDMEMDSKVSKVLVEKYISKTESSMSLDSNANYFVEIIGVSGNVDMEIDSSGLGANLVYSSQATADMEINSSAIGSLLGEDYVEIRGLILRPGQEVEIDMCKLTVTVNGDNAMHLMSNEGDFFDFLVGDNEIDIEAVGANNVQIDTYWKDRWL